MARKPDSTKKDTTPRKKKGVVLPYPDSDIPPVLQETIRRKIEEGDEGVDPAVFKEAVRRTAQTGRPE